ncbi:MAG: S-methyl-5'-thioinosine phosphorylase [Betaproteobacteria bacterium]|nr:S-methyl-5'-thioinosine phosphorylase [Betaproteobacteria bacterium]
MQTWGILGGSGLDAWEALPWLDEVHVTTPYGDPSAALRVARLESGSGGSIKVIYLPRHGADHRFAPHRINYRANLWALKQAGVSRLLASATVGSIDKNIVPGTICIPDQLIDYTWGREQTFSEDAAVLHSDFTQPFNAALRLKLIHAAGEEIDPAALCVGGVYACTQGPGLETAAEIAKLARDGCTVVGMTAMPEAALARELALPYALLCLAVNPAAGVAESAQAIDHDRLKAVMDQGIIKLKSILLATVQAPDPQG